MNVREMILNTADRKNQLLLSVAQVWEVRCLIVDYMAVENHLLNRFVGTFDNYEYTGAIAAIDLMQAEVLTLRKECADELSRRQALYRTLTQVCELLECDAPDDNGLGCAPLLEAITGNTSSIPGHTLFDMAANLHKKLFPRAVVSDGDAPRMAAIIEALEAARAYGRTGQ